MSKQEPYISFIATSRNDNHGGSLTRRMQIFVQGLIAQCKRFNLPAELILVEWNPPADRLPLAQELKWPADTGPLQVRIVTVPRELHLRYKHSDHLPLFQMIAKNVGIRRARAPYVLATNIDILFNDELIRFFAERRLAPGCMYRIDRFDADSNVPEHAKVQEQLEYCKTHLVRIARREGTIPVHAEGIPVVLDNDIFPIGSGISFGNKWSDRKIEHGNKPYRYICSGAELLLTPPDEDISGIKLHIEPADGVRKLPFSLSIVDERGKEVATGVVLGCHWISIFLPLKRGETRRFTFIIPDGGHPDLFYGNIFDAKIRTCEWTRRSRFELPQDLEVPAGIRLLNFLPELIAAPVDRFRQLIGLDAKRYDITRLSDGIGLLTGWHVFELKDGRYARWVNDGAEIICTNQSLDKRILELELEPGPGFFYDQFTLEVLDETGRKLSEFAVAGNEKRKRRFLRNQTKAKEGNATRKADGGSGGLKTSALKALPAIFRKQQIFHIELPLKKNAVNIFTLRAVYHGNFPVQHPVYMGFRVFRCQWLKPLSSEQCNWHIERDAIHLAASLKSAAVVIGAASKINRHRGQIAAVHTNACGDFTLMSREDWIKIRGYPELEIFSMHLDSVGCHAAVCAGSKEIILEEPMRIYHIEHGKGSGWTPEGETKLFQRIREKGISMLEYQEMVDMARKMFQGKQIEFNGENWGLADDKLPETTVG